MSVIKVAILGFGTVGEGIYKTIQSHEQELRTVLGKKVEVAAVLIKNKGKDRNIGGEVLVTTDFNEILALPQLDIVMEAIVEKEPSFTYLKKAINKGCHIVTANKEMFAHHGIELMKLAKENNVKIGFEATVGGGIPIIQTIQQLFKINRVHRIQGILNGTSNFILTEMRDKKKTFAEALKLAQVKGYAEADPTNDVEGADAFYKLMILSRIALGEEPDWEDVDLKGITTVTSKLVTEAAVLGLRFKHIAIIEWISGKIKGSIRPVLVGKTHPFFQIEGVENAINIQSDIVGSITLQGPGAGMFPTASAMIEDLVFVSQNNHYGENRPKIPYHAGTKKISSSKETWLITGLNRKFISSSISWIGELSDSTFIIRTTEHEVKRLFSLKLIKDYFQILASDEMDLLQQPKTAIY